MRKICWFISMELIQSFHKNKSFPVNINSQLNKKKLLGNLALENQCAIPLTGPIQRTQTTENVIRVTIAGLGIALSFSGLQGHNTSPVSSVSFLPPSPQNCSLSWVARLSQHLEFQSLLRTWTEVAIRQSLLFGVNLQVGRVRLGALLFLLGSYFSWAQSWTFQHSICPVDIVSSS